jgi:heparanase 1
MAEKHAQASMKELSQWLLMMSMLLSPSASYTCSNNTSTSCKKSGDEVVLVEVDVSVILASTDEVFICATLDWWPPDKCDYETCAWGQASILNLVSQI